LTPEPANPYAQAKDQLRKKLEGLQGGHSFRLMDKIIFMYGRGKSRIFDGTDWIQAISVKFKCISG